MSTLQTERLRGEPITDAHFEPLCELLGDPRVGATLGGVADRETVKDYLAHELHHWERHGFGYWIWSDLDTGEPVARGGLHHAHVGGRDEVEVGWTVVRSAGARGWRPSSARRRSRSPSARCVCPTSSRSRSPTTARRAA